MKRRSYHFKGYFQTWKMLATLGEFLADLGLLSEEYALVLTFRYLFSVDAQRRSFVY